MQIESSRIDAVANTLAELGNELERIFLVAGVESPFFDLALEVDRVQRKVANAAAQNRVANASRLRGSLIK